MSTTDLLLVLASLMALICCTSAIKCHVCETSTHNDSCGDPYESEHMEECKEEDFRMCYKQITQRFQVGKSGDQELMNTYYSRYCGHKDDNRNKCESTEGYNSFSIQCGCQEEGCNASNSLVVSMLTMAIGAVVATSPVSFL